VIPTDSNFTLDFSILSHHSLAMDAWSFAGVIATLSPTDTDGLDLVATNCKSWSGRFGFLGSQHLISRTTATRTIYSIHTTFPETLLPNSGLLASNSLKFHHDHWPWQLFVVLHMHRMHNTTPSRFGRLSPLFSNGASFRHNVSVWKRAYPIREAVAAGAKGLLRPVELEFLGDPGLVSTLKPLAPAR